ncbi:hypothetical protein VC83_02236 [Pseudogymnoascus destructans]|uniref:Uncharacterized protein n=1 Tax=Pseudogymnoascus destructans TaxID=655981 RepID=A0A177AJV0_9PEZI|nr:uncharacterized protein VC83_02236 [Pseudogymnoascus destructans]OAF61571.1 hypothetical protein VC83_02236 [Pseudogymnoascus destructans]
MDDVLLSILDLPKLNRGMSLNIKGEEKLVMAFTLGYIGDMPQQNDNAGILRQNAAKGCRSCLASKEERGDIHFDYMRLGGYHHHQVQLREHGSTLPPAKKKAWYQQWGMRETEPALFKISPALDIVLSQPPDLVVLAFASIAKSNATTCAWRMKPGQHQDAEKAIFEGRSMYRGLCNAASLASQMKVRNQCKGKGKGKGNASLTPSVSPPSVDTATEDFCSVIDSIEQSVQQEFELVTSMMDLKTASGSLKYYIKWRSRPNVHQGAHINDTIGRYGNSFSCNVLHCEDKHKLFKKWAEALNGRSVERSLMMRESINTTIRLLLQGAFKYSEPEISSQLKSLYEKCPSLMGQIMPSPEQPDNVKEITQAYWKMQHISGQGQ